MGRPLPGYRSCWSTRSPASGSATSEGEICLDLARTARPVGADGRLPRRPTSDTTRRHGATGYYHTGDVASRDDDGYLTYVGRTDDVFKASDYRISPFELESVLIEHPAVAEAAVVPAPDPLRLAVPKAYVVLAAGYAADAGDRAREILAYCREHLAPYKRIRRLEFADLPKTISGKIRRVELRGAENERAGQRPDGEYREEDFPRPARLGQRRDRGGVAGSAGPGPPAPVRAAGRAGRPRRRRSGQPRRSASTTTGIRTRCPSGLMPPST